LISTDPAHSIGDVFQQQLERNATASVCTPKLVLEELDARAAARAWLQQSLPALLDLVEKGTYLDQADARSLFDLTLPGVDEIMGALRLAELARSSAQRVVVDTAPTGHALRLLDAAQIIRGWTVALRAMANKGNVVASRLLRQNVRLAAEDLIDDLQRRVVSFEKDVLGAADFVVVT